MKEKSYFKTEYDIILMIVSDDKINWRNLSKMLKYRNDERNIEL